MKSLNNQMPRIAILSAHEGAACWKQLVKDINQEGVVQLIPFHGYTDEYYRRARTRSARAVMRFITFVQYPMRCFYHLVFSSRKYDAYLAVTSPFFLPAITSLLCRDRPVISLQNDLYPEALIASNLIRRGSMLDSLLCRVCRYGVKNSSVLVYICHEHRVRGESIFGRNDNTVVIPVGAIGKDFISFPPVLWHQKVNVLYCGTLGLMHETDTILQYFRNRRIPDLCGLEFRTSGAGKAMFEQEIERTIGQRDNDRSVVFGPPLTDDEWHKKMVSSQVGLILQSRGAGNVVFPSKVYSALVAGQAILAIANPESEVGRLIAANDCGWIISPGDLDALEYAFHEIGQPDTLLRKRQNAFRIGHGHFDVDKLVCEWMQIFIKIFNNT